MILCITEKPSVAKDIAKIIGANVHRDGYYEGNDYWVTWTFGHLCTLKEPQDYNPAWRHWSLGTIPMIPQRFGIKLIPDRGIEKQFKVIKDLIGKADEIINCGDAGQEGELIQRWVMQKAECKIPVKRLWISSLTDDAIREGFGHLRSEEELRPLYEAGLCRAIGDWILGINATRLFTIKYTDQNDSEKRMLSIGRVQTPTLALVVKRQHEIENFIPKEYYELKTEYRNIIFLSSLKPFETSEKGGKIIEEIKELPFIVTEVSKKKGKEAPPRLFDLTSLQVEANKKFSYGADETLRTIQSLYEKKLTTYPRVDTTYLTDDIYPKCGPILLGLSDYSYLIDKLKGRKLKKSKKVFDNSKVTDHHAIIPTGQPIPSNLSEIEGNIFDLIAKRFISVFYPDCTFEQTTVNGEIGKYKFKSNGKVILDYGWKEIYLNETGKTTDKSNQSDKEEDNYNIMPEFIKGEAGPHKPCLVKKTTQPPKYYTEGTLLKAMETAGNMVEDEDLREALKANGIGRPSTRAAIIQILYKRGYISKERKSIKATQAGIDLISIIKVELLKSAELTGIWENKLRKIERREYSPKEFIDELKQMIYRITYSVLSDNSNIKISK